MPSETVGPLDGQYTCDTHVISSNKPSSLDRRGEFASITHQSYRHPVAIKLRWETGL